LVKHVVQNRDLALGVSNDGELEINAIDFVDVSNPLLVGIQVIGRETNYLDIAFIPFILESSNDTELSCADRSYLLRAVKAWLTRRACHHQTLTEISRVREEDHPAIANEFMELDGTLGGLGFEVY
jgi:hypothetical protein